MSIEYSPVDVACNLGCEYCYENPMRDAGNISSPMNWIKAKKALEKENYQFSLHGGEPLLAPIEHLEEVFQFGLERFKRNGIQTNGTLVTDRHIELFKKYRVTVGISCDGPLVCNQLRRGVGIHDTALRTSQTQSAIERLCANQVYPSIIVTVHRMNGLGDGRRKLLDWFGWLEGLGVRNINLHMLETEKGMEHLALTERENIEAFTVFFRYSLVRKLKFEPFMDIYNLLTGDGKANCIWNGCDPLTTNAVRGVSRDGTLRNCGRTNKDGINWIKADQPGHERTFILFHTPQQSGGCKDCRFFVFCKGNCPGTAIDGDWRNRSVHCATWYHLLSLIEQEVVLERRMPLSRDKDWMDATVKKLLGQKEQTKHVAHVDTPHADWHCDDPHDDGSKGVEAIWLND